MSIRSKIESGLEQVRLWRFYGYRVAPILAYIILATAVAYNFWVQDQAREDRQQSATEAREAIIVSGRTATTIGCNRDFRSIKRLRAIIKDGAKRIPQYVAEGTLTEAQAKRALEDVKHNLRLSPLPDCRTAQRAITDDPAKTGKVPRALYPKKKSTAKN